MASTKLLGMPQRCCVGGNGDSNAPFIPAHAFNGDGKITGNTYLGSVSAPVSRLVYLFDQRSLACVGGSVSRSSDGYFEFTGLRRDRRFFVVAFDTTVEQHFNNTPSKRAEAFDNLVPV